VDALFGLRIIADAVPVVLCTIHDGVPFVTTPFSVKTVGPGDACGFV
jgi:hypothetical protein